MLLLQLKRHMTTKQIEKGCGSDWQHINRLIRGETYEPKYSVGVYLIEKHKKLVGDERPFL